MEGTNPAWIVLICTDQDVPAARVSAQLVRSNSSVPLIALVEKGVSEKLTVELSESFDSVTFATKYPKRLESINIGKKDYLLLQVLKMDRMFSSITAILPGTLVFQSFQDVMDQGTVVVNKEGDWKLVPVIPGRSKYDRVLELLLTGLSFNTTFIENEVAVPQGDLKGNRETILHSWSDLKSYTGSTIPFVDVSSDWINSFLKHGKWNIPVIENESFWQTAIRNKLKCRHDKSNETAEKLWIAVVGMACRFPKANSIEEYWQVLTSGENTSSHPPPNRTEIPSHIKANFLKCPIDEFDASFFNIAPIEAANTDVQARFLLEVSWEAFEDAGINPEKFRSTSVGIFHGSWIQDYKDLMNLSERPDKHSFHKYIGNSFGCTAAKLSYFYGFTGPNIATESGCSSSMVAVQLACQHLLNGECRLALATGTNIILHMDSKAKMVWSDDGISKTFGSSANGYGRGEGVGVLVLKRYSDALRDGNRIHGIIRGCASSQEGLSKSFGSPTVENEVRTMVNALKAAKVSPNQVDYIEAHATGTRVGDPIEAEALVKAYSSQQERMSPLLIGSVKTNIGHTESCSGIASIIKVLLALKHEAIPPHINVKTINPKIDFSSIPGKITLEMEEWKRSPTKPRIAGISNFGITGTDVHLIIQEPTEDASQMLTQKQPAHILTLSAKTKPALDQLSLAFANFLENEVEGDVTLEDITYTVNACRPHHSFRKAILGRNKEELVLQLKERASLNPQLRLEFSVTFIFPDVCTNKAIQTETYAVLYSTFPAFKIQMDFCDLVCRSLTGFSPISYLKTDKLKESNVSLNYLALYQFSVIYSIYKLWESWGVKPSYVVQQNSSKTMGFGVSSIISGELTIQEAFNTLNSLETNTILAKYSGHPPLEVQLIYCNTGEKETVALNEALTTISAQGCHNFIEVGFQNKFYTGQTSSTSPTPSEILTVPLEENPKEFETGLETIFSTLAELYTAGYPIDWEGFYMHHPRRKVSLPHYPFQRKSIWFKKQFPQNLADSTGVVPTWMYQHPLLGNYVGSSSIEGKKEESSTFENCLFAQVQAPYLLDHVIGSDAIFPASGYLEMVIAAHGKFPLVIEDFRVHFPLNVPKDTGINFKTVMRSETNSKWSTWSILIQTRLDEKSKTPTWKEYASGKATSLEFCELKTSSQNPLNIDEIKMRCPEQETGPSNFYTQISKVGINFGPTFRTVKKTYRSESSGELELLVQVSIPPDALNYFCHPLLSDVMLQSYLLLKSPFPPLHVPISVKRYVCHRRLTPQECSSWKPVCFHVYCNEKEDTLYLLDSKGRVVIEMVTPEFIPTTVGTMLTAAGIRKDLPLSQEQRQADTYHVTWKPTDKFQTQDTFSLNTSVDVTTVPSYQNLLKSIEHRNRLTSREELVFSNVNRLCLMYVLKAMFEMGWKPEMGRTFGLEEIAGEFKITKPFIKAFRHYLSYLVELGMLVEESNKTFTIKFLPDKPEIVELSIKELSTQLSNYGIIQSLDLCGSHLAQILQGKVKGEQLLYELGDQIYKTNLYYRNCVNASSQIFFEIARNLGKYQSSDKSYTKIKRLRILELGGKTGLFTREAISLLVEEDIQYTYFFTESSPKLTENAEQIFANECDNLIFKTLNIEKDPLEQGFPPAYFDIVVALDILHKTKELKITLKNIRRLMKPWGNLIIGEMCRPIREIDLTFGISDGYWQFRDFDVRPSHPTMSADQWLKLFEQCGFAGPSSKSLLAASRTCVVVGTLDHPHSPTEQLQCEMNYNSLKVWILLHDLDNKNEILEGILKQMVVLGRNIMPHSVLQNRVPNLTHGLSENTTPEGILCVFQGEDKFASQNCRTLLEPLLTASKFLIKSGNGSLCVATFGLIGVTEEVPVGCPSSATVLGFLRCMKLEIPSMNTKLIDLDPGQSYDKMVDTLVQELWMGDNETEICYRHGVRYGRRLIAVPPTSPQELMVIPHEVENYSIQLPETNLLSDLTFASKSIEIGADDVIVEVRAASLNFKDVLNVMKPSKVFETMSTIGIDFSGIISSVGENVNEIAVGTPVFGCSWDQSTFCRYLPTSVKDFAVMPSRITFEEAATYPLAFLTAWYCLVNVAQASAGQTVLIHAASGGVGLIAIQIAKLIDIRILATAGSQRKREFLSNLGISHVYNSRNLEYGQKVKEITNGKGVDIVLNCLTGSGFKETTLEITKVGGYFVEISKLDIWTEDEVRVRKPGVIYKIVDLANVNRNEIRPILSRLATYIEHGNINPLPITRFTASRLIQALKFLQKAKHIGKVVISMPRFDIDMRQFRDSIFNQRSTYLITGGKGALGLAIAEWMVSMGAKYLVLMGRGSPNQTALELVEKLVEEVGAVIIFKAADVADLNQCKQIFEEISENPNLPPLRGIHHCAGVLSDRILMNQDWDSFEYVLRPKVKGAQNLHILSATLPLEFFVVHSSMAATFGNFGQSNYSAANSFMEALITKRRWMGLQGMAVSWGQWNAGLAEDMGMELCEPMTINQGIVALENIQLDNSAAVVAGFLKFDKLVTLMPTYYKAFLEDIAAKDKAVESKIECGSFNQLKRTLAENYFKAEDDEGKEITVRRFVREEICETLGLKPNEVGDNVKFASLGLDSLLGVEFYNKLQAELGSIQLGYIDLEEQGTVEGISYLLKTLLDGNCSGKEM